ncbi:protein chibby homolog 1-like [Branchiostoma lanceolatum]|uniref:protein chibby homolog 1-like n=1 Tax=Branchiostoma lanceolatum TaxID=7740 RepID=UPI00345532DD
MPLFGNKFSPKKTSPRRSASLSNLSTIDEAQKAAEFGLDYGPIRVKLGGTEVSYHDGQWISEGGGSGVSQREVVKLKKDKQKLEEENNLLKLKMQILLDMLAEQTCESHLLEKEVQEMRGGRSRKK